MVFIVSFGFKDFKNGARPGFLYEGVWLAHSRLQSATGTPANHA
jgi:hypothetical protein